MTNPIKGQDNFVHGHSQSANQDPNLEIKPWYREFWAWYIATPLIVVVVVSLSFVTVAVKKADNTVIDNYYKEGRMINQSIAQDQRALNWGVSVDLQWQPTSETMVLQFHSEVLPAPAKLILWLDHPFDETQDVELVAPHLGEGRFEVAWPRRQHNWYLTLVPDGALSRNDAPWRLKGDIHTNVTDHWQLVPAVSAEH